MRNVGEEIAGEWLRVINGCDFVEYNLYTPDVQGEIDVVAVNRRERTVYVCEVAVHLVTGLQYVKDRRPNNVAKFCSKFEKDIDYAERYFEDHKRVIMLWSPVVKDQASGAKYNQLRDVQEVANRLRETRGVELEMMINERYAKALSELRSYAAARTEALKSPILRFLQIEAQMDRHLRRLERSHPIKVPTL